MIIKEWKVAGTQVQGLSHIKNGKPCQDKFAFKQTNSVNSISIADGAGSVIYAELGAEIVTDQINKTIIKNFDDLWYGEASEVRKKITHSLRTRIGIHAKKRNVPLKEFASTLIFASVKDNRFIAGHIGDGILGYLKNGSIYILSPPDNGEFINETFFITSKSYKHKFRLFRGELDHITGFVLMTDGSCESLYDKKNKSIAPIVKTLFEWLDNYPIDEVRQALFENFENVIRKRTTDDCSIGLMKLAEHTFLITDDELCI